MKQANVLYIDGEEVRIEYNGVLTWRVVVTCAVAACGGLLFGYDNGITGGVISMSSFLERFFPEVHTDNRLSYCRFNNKTLQLFTSSLFLSGAVAALVGSWTTMRYGRRGTMILGGICFLTGAAVLASSMKVGQLVLGRVILGFGVGLANQSVPLFLSETAPHRLRGAMNIMFQLAITLGILSAQLINLGTQHIEDWGWRLSLGLAAVPASILLIGSLIVPDSPASLLERGLDVQAFKALSLCRGVKEVDLEYMDIAEAASRVETISRSWRKILERRYRPQLVLSLTIPIFQQLTGINAIMFYAPQLLGSLNHSSENVLRHAVEIAAINVVATIVAIASVDHFGRRALFALGGMQMFATQVIISLLLAQNMETGELNQRATVVLIVIICVYVAGFAWSWGPLGWLVPSEVQPLEIRSAGQALAVCANFVTTFFIGQAFLSMLCAFKWGIFLFFAGWVFLMTLFVYFFVPETKNVPLEEVENLFAAHWYWGRFAKMKSGKAENSRIRSTIGSRSYDNLASEEDVDDDQSSRLKQS